MKALLKTISSVVLFMLACSWAAADNTWTAIGPYGGFIRTLIADANGIFYAGTWGSGVFKSRDGGANWYAANSGLGDKDVWELAVDPSVSDTLYAGTSTYGVYKSINGGLSWSASNKGLPSQTITTLVVSPSTPACLYVGLLGGGVYKTTDGGQNWAAVNMGLTDKRVWELVIDPALSSVVYAGTSGGVFKTVDGGSSWTAMNAGLTNTTVYALAGDPQVPATLFAGTYGGVFKSLNGGLNWTPSGAGMGNISVSLLKIHPVSTQIIYAMSASGLFKSSDGGSNWYPVSGMSGKNVWAIAFSASNPSYAWAGTRGQGIFENDWGESWVSKNHGLTNTRILGMAVNPASAQTIIASSWEGDAFKSLDGGTSWQLATAGLTNNCVNVVVFDATSPGNVYAGTWSGGIFKSTDGGNSWSAQNDGLTNKVIYTVVLEPSLPSTLYTGTYGGGVFKSTDGAGSWAAMNTGLTNMAVQALAVDPSSVGVLYAGTANGVFRTTDGAWTWTDISSNIGSYNIISLAVDPLSSQIVYAGTDRGVYKSLDGGGVWTYDGLSGVKIQNLAFDPSALSLFAGTLSGVYRRTGDGAWTNISAGLLDQNVQELAFSTSAPSMIYAGTDRWGAFKMKMSIVLGGSVTHNGSGLADVVMNGLPGNPRTDSSGAYSVVIDYGWSGTVTPTLAGYTFTPSSRTYLPLSSDQSGQNFTAELETYTVSYTAGQGGMIQGLSPQVVAYGGSCEPVSAVANGGYYFFNWTGTDGFASTDNPLTVSNVTRDMTIMANFKPCTITVTSPNQSSRWRRGQSYDILWTKEGSQNNLVKVQLLRNGSVVLTISSSTANDGSYRWLVPTNLKKGTGYMVRIVTLDNLVSGSSQSFQIL